MLRWLTLCGIVSATFIFQQHVFADWPTPVLNTVYPPGGQVGTSVTVTLQGSGLEELTTLHIAGNDAESNHFNIEKTGDLQFVIAIAEGTPTGLYDLCAVGKHGVSAPRPFSVGRLEELIETEPNDETTSPMSVSLDRVINGTINPHGDVDNYRISATAGTRLVIECFAERIDSQLHGVLELYDPAGKLLASNRGEVGVDPLLDVIVPVDGDYLIKLFDLTFTGDATRFYRLDIDTQPRVAFAFPPVVQRGKPTTLTLFGTNLQAIDPVQRVADLENGVTASKTKVGVNLGTSHRPEFEQVSVEWTFPASTDSTSRQRGGTNRLSPMQLASELVAYHHPGANGPIWVGVTDVPVVIEPSTNHNGATAQTVNLPCEIAGRLADGGEQDWYAFDARRGEVLWIEAFGERIGSPVDLDLVIFDSESLKELAHLSDETAHQGKPGFPADHLDPAGRWVAPADGRYLLMIRNLIGGTGEDPRRVYRIGIRREEPEFHVVAQARLPEQISGLNLPRGKRELLEVAIERRRGHNEAIRVTAENLPLGVECPPIWIGPGCERAPLIISATSEAPPFLGALQLRGEASDGSSRELRGMMLVRNGVTMPARRITDEITLATTAFDFPLSLTATMEAVGFPGTVAERDGSPIVYQGAVIDLLITADRRHANPTPISLRAVGLPESIDNQYAEIAADANQAWLSYRLPMTLPPGPYTIAIQGTAEVPISAFAPGKDGKTPVTCLTNPVSFHVEEGTIEVDVDPFAPKKIARGEIIQLNYTAKRRRGFIGKIHTELAAPGGVIGIRGRGVTFTGNTESGTIQIIATENAPLGKQPFLRLDAVGTVEDRPTYRGGKFFELEITE